MTRHLENPLPLPPLNRDFTCIVTGCTNGIGREIARQLVEAGAHVVMAVWKTRSANELIKKWQYDWSGKNNPLNIEIHHVGFVDPEDMNVLTGKRKYTNLMGYSSSKLEQVMFSSMLYRILPTEAGINVVCASPGVVQTNFVRPVAEDEMFKVIRTGKHKTKQWKRMLTKVTFVGQGFTRKPPKYERFIHRTPIWSNKF